MGLGSSTMDKVANNPMDLRIQKKGNMEKRRIQAEKKREKKLKAEQKRLEKAEKKKRKNLEKKVPPPIKPPPPPRPVFNETDYDVSVIRKIKKQLLNDSETFILNQVLLSVEFFRNYQGDIQEAARLNRREQEEQTKKIAPYNKRVLILDRIIQTMEKRINYEYRRGPLKGTPQTLQRFTKYIIFENIEIIKPYEVEDSNEIYSKIEEISEKPSLKIVIDNDEKFNKVDNQEHVGFYCLRNAEIFAASKYGQHSLYNDNDDYDDADDDEDHEAAGTTQMKPNRKIRDSIAVKKPHVKRIQQQIIKNYQQSMKRPASSTPSPSSSEYDYTYIHNINSHRPLNEIRTSAASDEPLSALTIPQSCFINVTMKPEEDDDDDDDDEDYNKKQVQIKQSFHSKSFFYYFTNAFKYILAPELGFNQTEIENATWKGASIYIEPYEIIPAIQCKWPDKVAYDFETRSRHLVKNGATGKHHQWPPKELIKHVINRQCHIIPNGYAPKEGGNSEREFEWQIAFPAAEQFLESNLSNAQLKIYVMFKILIKTFIEPLIGDRYNLTDHIRHHLFWQFERQYPLMSDEFLGERLMHILNSLLERIGKTSLPDYFLPKRNLLYNIPSSVLIAVHEGLYRITEFPVRHLMIALRNLNVIEKPFYPTLNYKRLYECLTMDTILLFNPELGNQRKKENQEAVSQIDNSNDVIAIGVIGLCEMQEKQDKKVKRTVRFNEMKATRKRKDSVESINQFVVDKLTDERRRQKIFELFILHYISMAKISANFNAFEQSLLFLKQVEIMSSILVDDNINVQTYIDQVREIRITVTAAKEAKIREKPNGPQSAPPLPRRESILDPKQQRRLTMGRKSVTIHEVEDDPYTNIDLIRSSTIIQPSNFNDTDDDDDEALPSGSNGAMGNRPRKSILTNGNRTNGIVTEHAQIHTPRHKSAGDKNEDLKNSTKSKINIANRRKSSTKFVQMANINDSDDDDDDEPFPQTAISNGFMQNGPRKSILANTNRPNGIVIEQAQIHTPKHTSFEDKKEDMGKSNKSRVNIGNRRKSSTKFVQKGVLIESEDDDDDDDDDDQSLPPTTIPNGITKNEPRKSILARPNGIVIERAQIHTPRQASFDDKNEDLVKSKANIANRRKSSTKFAPMTNGIGESEEDTDEAEQTSF